MNKRNYLKPPWFQQHVINRLLPWMRPALISTLSVQGRHSGHWYTIPVAVLESDGERYLVSYRGESDWARNLRYAKRGRLRSRGRVEEISVSELPVSERAVLLEEYRAIYGKMPTVSNVMQALPDPQDHPIFRIITRSHDEVP
jgi:deazaflavin-dependent oxidoreductase (nitroreductase family)